MTYDEMWRTIASAYSPGEAKAVARLALEAVFGLSAADIYSGKVSELSGKDEESLREITRRLALSEPVQYVIGCEEFCGRTFKVRPGVLIPRPETEELCRMAVETAATCRGGDGPVRILDIGTGSGCIAITLSLDIEGAETEAWDMSDTAIGTARENAAILNANVTVRKQDALNPPQQDCRLWNMIVSNPPYVCESERQQMHPNVLRHEPEEALFVPDDDPLRFYSAITEYASHALKEGGALLLEGNPTYAAQMVALLRQNGFKAVETVHDMFGKERFVKGTR